MKEIASTEAKTKFGALLDMAQREPVMIRKKDRAVAVIMSMQDFAEHQAMKLKLLQQAVTAGIDSGVSAQSFDEVIAEAEAAAVADEAPSGSVS